MQQLGQTMPHLRLILRMGRTTGADMARAHQQGLVGQAEWADMVQSCRACAWATRCPDWLEQNETASLAPRTCANRHRFAVVKAMQILEN